MNEPINAGTFQEYDYNNENAECEWKQITEYWRMKNEKMDCTDTSDLCQQVGK